MRTFLFRLCLVLGLLAAFPVAGAAPRDLDLYLLVGQSNMAGRGKVTPADQRPDERVLMLTKAGEWKPAVAPLHFDKRSAGVGLGRTFGLTVADARPGRRIGLIPCAVGGSPISAWQPGAYYKPTKSHPWDDAIRRAKLAMKSGRLRAILWHQGESDSKSGPAEVYAERLHDLVARFREELGAPDVPFIAGQMGQFKERPWNAAKKRVDRAHRELPDHVAKAAFVSSDDLGHKGDKVHFDAAGYRRLGRRFAAAYLKLAK